jgi:hypothetical protein
VYAFGQKQYLSGGHQGIIAYGVDKDVIKRKNADKRKRRKEHVNKDIEQDIGKRYGAFH